MISNSLIEIVKRKCYVTDTSETTTNRLNDIITASLSKIKRLIGLNAEFDFEEEGNEEELELLKNYCWYAWNDSEHEFKNNYLDDINSIRHKHELEQYVSEENK